MNYRIIIFNLVYYSVIFLLYLQGKQDPSSSLGYGFLILGFFVAALITLLVLMVKKTIVPKTILDKIGIFTATPILCLVAVALLTTFNETPASEWYFDKSMHRYKVNTYIYNNTGKQKRIEYYKSSNIVDTKDPFATIDKWVKDSTWIYFSKSGDTSKKVSYKNGIQIKL
jgi:hypothetical protein